MRSIHHYTIVSYRPDGDDYCRGCHMASSSSHFDLQETGDVEQAAIWVADKLMLVHKDRNSPEICEWEIYVLVDGHLYTDTEDAIKDRAQAIFSARLEQEKRDQETRDAKLKEKAEQKRQELHLAKIAHEKAEYLRLEALYGDKQ